MKALDKIINQNYVKFQIPRAEYESARAQLNKDEFHDYYTTDEAGFYKIIYPDESEVSVIILNNMQKSLVNIKYWVWFFGALAIISVIASIIFYVNISKLFH